MADTQPDPLVPPEVDLRGMEFMPLKGDVLFKSTTWLKGTHESRCAALRLWWHSFGHEVPAASLPDDDQLLAEYAGYGEVVKAWLKIKPKAMRGWVLCSDGRWYHKTVAELALEAWKGRIKNREKIRKWREKKAAENLAGNGGGNGNDTVSVTVTKPLRNGREGEGERQTELQGQRERQLPKEEEASSAAPRATTAPNPGDDPGPMPSGLDRRCDQAHAVWQEIAKVEGWPEVMFLNGERRGRLQGILDICGGIDGWKAALETARDADFLHGTDGRMHGWFDFDWLLDQQKFTRLMEGRYAERHRNDRTDERSTSAALAGLREELSG